MRTAFAFALGLVVLFGLYTVKAKARPKKVEYHSALCLKTSSGTGTLVYNVNSVQALSDMSVVCPLQHITFTDDDASTASATITAKAWLNSVTSGCQLFSEGTMWVNIPGSTAVGGVIHATGPIVLPTTTPSSPASLYLSCTLKKNAELGSIQIEL